MAEDWRADAGRVFAEVVDQLADQTGRRITEEVIQRLQARPAIVLSDSSSANLWDEICIQTRSDSELLLIYDSAVERAVQEVTEGIGDAERVALWPQTYNGALFVDGSPDAAFDEARSACSTSDIREYIARKLVAYERMNYENEVIRLACGE